MKKYHRKSRQTLLLCYMRVHSFSANQKRVIFFMYIINMNKMLDLLILFSSWLKSFRSVTSCF